MSEREDLFFTRAEKALEALEKTKVWYKSAAMAFAVSFLVCVSGAGALGYRVGRLESDMDELATKKSVVMLNDNNEAFMDAVSCLIADKYQEAYDGFKARYKIMNANIFEFTTERGGKE